MPYSVTILPAADRVVARLPRDIRTRIAVRLAALASNPRPPGCVKLAGEEGVYRIRVGDYRIIYAIHDDRLIVVIIDVGHRREVYRRL